jgi:TonB-linked SusC/RagA family outer membrane protein
MRSSPLSLLSGPPHLSPHADGTRVQDLISFLCSKTIRLLLTVSLIFLVLQSNAQEKTTGTISGKVADSKGLPVSDVTVTVEGPVKTAKVTDGAGNYLFGNLPAGSYVLHYTVVGYTKTSRQLTLAAGQTAVMDISLEGDSSKLNEVVVIGYGSRKRTNLTGSVSTVNAKELTATPTAVITQAIAGRTPGVYVKSVNGQPGENKVQYNIRGFGNPLIIIDGLPAASHEFNQLDPNDIESFSVLKDAASAAVYGARAGNGVILVTTKRGTTGKAKVSFTSNYSLQYFAVFPEFVSSEQYARMENLARFNEGLAPVWTDEQIQKFADGSDPNHYANTNWKDLTLRKYAPQVQHNLNIQGGNEKVKYFISGGYFNQTGLERDSETESKRYNLRSNIDINVTDRLKIGLNLSLLNQDYFGSVVQLERSSIIGIMTALFRARPQFPASYPDPTKLPSMGGSADNAPTVYLKSDNVGYKKWDRLTVDGKLNLTYDLPFGFQARANYQFNRSYYQYKETRRKTPVYNYNFDNGTYTLLRYTFDPSRLLENRTMDQYLNQQYFLSWNKKYGNHNISALAVYEILSNNVNSVEASRIRYSYDVDYLFAGPDLDKDNTGTASEGGRQGIISRINYDYNGKYLFEFSSRYDASPRFPKETRWGFFPSVSVGWNISREKFMESLRGVLTNLKLRASTGRLGYDDIGNFQYLELYSVNNGVYIYNGTNNVVDRGIRAGALANPSITWEKMTTSNIGLDFGLFNNKLEGTIEYFYRKRSDVLGARIQSLPNVVGATLPQINYAEYDNRGVELALGYRNSFREFNYSIGGNISWNREKTILIDQTQFSSEEAKRRGDQVGQWTDRFWGKQAAGLFKSQQEIDGWADQDGRNNATIRPGDIKLVDYNGDGRITAEDDVLIGRGTTPRLSYGLTLSLSWKGFDLNMLWQGAGLYDFNLRNSPDLTLPFYAGNTPITAMLRDSYIPENPWLPANPNGTRPLYRTDNFNRNHSNNQNSSFWLIDGSYIRLKSMDFGYNLPARLIRRVRVDRVRIYVSGYNLLTFSKLDYIDPEIDTNAAATFGSYYPPVGTYNAGILLQF